MINKVFVYQDVVSGAYGELISARNKADIVRSLRGLIAGGRVDPYVIRDTVVYEIGEFNLDSPVPALSVHPSPVLVIRGDSLYAEFQLDKASGGDTENVS